MGRLFITGDTHGKFAHLNILRNHDLSKDDVVVILGDVGVNYYGGRRDKRSREILAEYPCQFFLIHGNHERRPRTVKGYCLTYSLYNGAGWVEPRYPNQFFAMDGEFEILGKRVLVLGGAYSVDKQYRLDNGWNWFDDEQMDDEVKDRLLHETELEQYHYVFSHTCPYDVIPRDMFLGVVDQGSVDNSMEIFLQKISERIKFDKWFCGHWHTDRVVDNYYFLYNSIKLVE